MTVLLLLLLVLVVYPFLMFLNDESPSGLLELFKLVPSQGVEPCGLFASALQADRPTLAV